MSQRAAITVLRSLEEVERLWKEAEHPAADEASVTFRNAPGDRGTEIHAEVDGGTGGGPLGDAVRKLTASDPMAQVKDDLRRFKARVETGEVPRSEAVPEGESAERKLKQRPAQPLETQ